jgi:hypothetical protein
MPPIGEVSAYVVAKSKFLIYNVKMNTQPIAHGLNRGLWVSSQRLAFSYDEAKRENE